VTDLSDVGSREFSVYVAPDRQMHFVGGGADRARSWADVKPAILGSIIISALRDARKLPSRDAALGVQAFARFYNLPQMQEVLRAGRQRQKQP
jgi:hypothetical protein